MQSIHELSQLLGKKLSQRQFFCTVAESCTGGGLAAAITEVEGCSQWFDCGFVTYSNASKQRLGVPIELLNEYGAVSKEVVAAMAQMALNTTASNVSIAVSGIAGPGGGTPQKPVGTVWIAWANHASVSCECFCFTGNRFMIRQQAIQAALLGLIRRLDNGFSNVS